MTEIHSAARPFEDAEAQVAVDGLDAATEEARDRIEKLISALGVEAVIWVDDIHFSAGEGTAEDVTEPLAASLPLQASVVELLRSDDSAAGAAEVDEEDPAAIADFVREFWSGFSAGLQSRLLETARTMQQDLAEHVASEQITDDLRAQTALATVFEGTAEFVPMSMTDWTAGWRDLLHDGRKYLVLFDRTFTREQQGADDKGEELLGELVGEVADNVWAGLLTRHATDEASERDLTHSLRQRFPAHADRLIAIGKFRTTSLQLLPAGLRALLLVRELGVYRKLVGEALAAAAQAAASAFSELSDYAVVEAIAVAQEEGSFELDHPLRLAHHAHAGSLAVSLRDDTFASESLPALRSASVGAFRNAESDAAQIRALLRADTFEADEHVNRLGLPVEIGDIFRVQPPPDGEAKTFILLGQACDLSVRAKGLRTPEIRTVTLSRVVPAADGGTRGSRHEIGYLEPGSDQRWAIDLRAGYDLVVPVCVLDATVFNEDGRSVIAIDYVETRPMAESWLARLVALKKQAKKATDTFASYEEQLKKVSSRDKILASVAADLTAGSTDLKSGVSVQIDSASKTVTYGIARVGRLRSEIAMRTADLAAQYRSRPAFELGLVREKLPSES